MARKKAAEQARMNKLRSTPKALASAGKDVTGFPFLGAHRRPPAEIAHAITLCPQLAAATAHASATDLPTLPPLPSFPPSLPLVAPAHVVAARSHASVMCAPHVAWPVGCLACWLRQPRSRSARRWCATAS